MAYTYQSINQLIIQNVLHHYKNVKVKLTNSYKDLRLSINLSISQPINHSNNALHHFNYLIAAKLYWGLHLPISQSINQKCISKILSKSIQKQQKLALEDCTYQSICISKILSKSTYLIATKTLEDCTYKSINQSIIYSFKMHRAIAEIIAKINLIDSDKTSFWGQQ